MNECFAFFFDLHLLQLLSRNFLPPRYNTLYIAPRIPIGDGKYIHIPKGFDRISISISISISHAATVLLLVTSFSSSSSSSSSTTYHYHLANNKHLVSCSCLGKRTKEMTG